MPSNAYVSPSFDLENQIFSPQNSTNPIHEFIIEIFLANNFPIPSFTFEKKKFSLKGFANQKIEIFYKCFLSF
jgi:hypothetical protein